MKKLLLLFIALAALATKVSAATSTTSVAVFKDGVLTLYYDISSSSVPQGEYYYWYPLGDENGSDYHWLDDIKLDVKKVVFDSSFHKHKRTQWINMFNGLENLTTVEGTENLNLSKTTNMDAMFASCKSLTTIDVSKMDMSHVTNIEYMFRYCESLEYLDVSNWNVSNIYTMAGLFEGCTKLKSIDVSKWNVSNVGTMSYMFRDCSELTVLDLGNWDTTSKLVLTQSMFSGCKNLTTIFSERDFNPTNFPSQNSENMFLNCTKLTGEMGTPYTPSYIDVTYARIDKGTGNPGYFTSRTIPIDAAHFPDANFRTDLKDREVGLDDKLTVEELLETEDLDLGLTYEIENLQGIQYFTELTYLNFIGNHVNKANLSKNTNLHYLYCANNELHGEAMDDFVAHLPTVSGGMLFVYDNYYGESDHNEMTPEQVAIANQKGWTVKLMDESTGKWGNYSETKGFWQINEKRFPDENFRNRLLDGESFRCTGIVTVEDTENYAELDLGCEGIEDLTGIEYFTPLEGLYFGANQLKTADLSKNTSLTYICCEQNQMSGADMDFFVNHLPTTNGGTITAYHGNNSLWPEANEMTPEQVAIANQKGWTVEVWDETDGKYGNWSETKGFWRLTEEIFPDEKFRNYVESYFSRCTGVLTYEDATECEEFFPCNLGISDMTGIELFTGLYSFECDINQLTSLDLSGLDNLIYVSICNNQIKGTDMDNLIASLRVVPRGDDEGVLYALYDVEGRPEGNEVTAAQVEAARRRGWIVYAFDPTIGKYGEWVEYTGAKPTGIISLTDDSRQPSTIYNLSGQHVSDKPSRKGVYIQNGRKVVVK